MNITFLKRIPSTFPPSWQYELKRLSVPDKSYEQCVLTLRLDALEIPERVILVEIDTEGHEVAVLQGMTNLLQRDHPTLIVETHAAEVGTNLCNMGYRARKLEGSPNILFLHSSFDIPNGSRK